MTTRPHFSQSESHRAWSAALDRLEREIGLAEQLLSATGDASAAEWEPPQLVGPIPHALVARAQRIQRRQIALQRELAAALVTNQQHRAVAERALQAPAPPPAYLDTSA